MKRPSSLTTISPPATGAAVNAGTSNGARLPTSGVTTAQRPPHRRAGPTAAGSAPGRRHHERAGAGGWAKRLGGALGSALAGLLASASASRSARLGVLLSRSPRRSTAATRRRTSRSRTCTVTEIAASERRAGRDQKRTGQRDPGAGGRVGAAGGGRVVDQLDEDDEHRRTGHDDRSPRRRDIRPHGGDHPGDRQRREHEVERLEHLPARNAGSPRLVPVDEQEISSSAEPVKSTARPRSMRRGMEFLFPATPSPTPSSAMLRPERSWLTSPVQRRRGPPVRRGGDRQAQSVGPQHRRWRHAGRRRGPRAPRRRS